jgi:hypothetical protein
MNRINLGISIFFAIGIAAAQPNSPSALVFRDVTVIECTGRSPQAGMSVLIFNGHLQAIRATTARERGDS